MVILIIPSLTWPKLFALNEYNIMYIACYTCVSTVLAHITIKVINQDLR